MDSITPYRGGHSSVEYVERDMQRNAIPRTPLATAAVTIALGQQARTPASFDKVVQPFLAKNCYGCHNEKLSSGKLNLTEYKTRASVAAGRDRWNVILKKLKGGEMPPVPLPRPNAGDLRAVTGWIE